VEKFGETRAGVGKVACWSKKAVISLKRVKTEEKLLQRAYRKSSMLFRFFGSPPYFYFRFCLYGHRHGGFCLIFARTAQQLVVQMDSLAANHVRIVRLCCQNKAHCTAIFAIAQLSCSFRIF